LKIDNQAANVFGGKWCRYLYFSCILTGLSAALSGSVLEEEETDRGKKQQ
jgi:ABC-type uncharacterized transport system permease subunit